MMAYHNVSVHALCRSLRLANMKVTYKFLHIAVLHTAFDIGAGSVPRMSCEFRIFVKY
jgi:hypothetical protein